MTRANFKQGDLVRAVRGVKKSGCIVAAVKILPSGEISILVNANDDELKEAHRLEKNEWDEVL